MNQRNIDRIGFYTTNLINEFNKKILSCNDIHDYLNLVASVYIFKNLVSKMMEDELSLEISREEAQEQLSVIQKQADLLTADFIKHIEVSKIKKNQKEVN